MEQTINLGSRIVKKENVFYLKINGLFNYGSNRFFTYAKYSSHQFYINWRSKKIQPFCHQFIKIESSGRGDQSIAQIVQWKEAKVQNPDNEIEIRKWGIKLKNKFNELLHRKTAVLHIKLCGQCQTNWIQEMI